MHRDRSTTAFAFILACLALTACSHSATQVVVANVPQQAAAQKPVQTPAQNGPIAKGAESGKKQLLGSASALAADCTSEGYPTVKITKGPPNGQMAIEHGETIASYPKDNPRSACNLQKIPSVIFYYTSNSGYTGTDNVSLEVLFPDGTLKNLNFSISVI
jgi:hypothetical protein